MRRLSAADTGTITAAAKIPVIMKRMCIASAWLESGAPRGRLQGPVRRQGKLGPDPKWSPVVPILSEQDDR